MVAIGRRYGSVDHRRSKVVTCAAWSWRVREAQSRSLGLCWFQILRSPTCGPCGVVIRNTAPAGGFGDLLVEGLVDVERRAGVGLIGGGEVFHDFCRPERSEGPNVSTEYPVEALGPSLRSGRQGIKSADASCPCRTPAPRRAPP